MSKRIIGANADYHQRDFRFPRRQSLYTPPLEKSPPLESWTSATLGGIGVIVFMLAAFWSAGLLASL